MTHKLQVKEHLRNGALYQSLSETSLSVEWKCRLFDRHTMQRQFKAALQYKSHFLKRFVCIGIPIICITLVFAAYFGFIHTEHWYENIVQVINFDISPMGLKEVLIFIAVVNGLTFLIKKRAFTL